MKIVNQPLKTDILVIERSFITNEGYFGVCVCTQMGHRCGYVGVDESHPLYGDGDFWEADVHGGITYSRGFQELENALGITCWFFGFDCMHAGDIPDAEAVKLYGFEPTAEAMKLYGFELWALYLNGTARSTQYVIDEIKKLSAQLTPQSLMMRKMS